MTDEQAETTPQPCRARGCDCLNLQGKRKIGDWWCGQCCTHTVKIHEPEDENKKAVRR